MTSKTSVAVVATSLMAACALGCGETPAHERVVARQGALYAPLPPDVCATALCPAGTHCEADVVQCFAEPCPPVPVCVPDPQPQESPRCGPGPVCDISCDRGYVLDDKGCVTCACVPPPKDDDPCATVRCADGMHCEVENVQCVVAPCPPSTICVPDKPPACEGICGLYCEFGNVIDEDGCPICRCNPPPRGVADDR